MSLRIYQADSGIISIPSPDGFYAIVGGPVIPLANLQKFKIITGSAGAWDPDFAGGVGAVLGHLWVADVSLYMLFLDSSHTMVEFLCLQSIVGPGVNTSGATLQWVQGNGVNAVMPSPLEFSLPVQVLGKSGYVSAIQFQAAADLGNAGAAAQNAEVNLSVLVDY